MTGPLFSTAQSEILGILQREQDHAMSLLSLSPLLSSLFISYANQAAALESAATTPSPDSQEWKALQANIIALQGENERLKSENHELAEKAVASHKVFQSQISSLREADTAQQGDIESLRAKLKAEGMYCRLMADSDSERAALQIRVMDLEVGRNHIDPD